MASKGKRKLIGIMQNLTQNVDAKYLSKNKKKATMIIIEISKDKKYGAIARLYERNSIFDRYQETTTKTQRKKFSDHLKNLSDTPLDTSKWVKPDEESIRNALVESLFFLEIFKKEREYLGWAEHKGRADVLYSILHSHSPRNPQNLSNFSYDPYFLTIMGEFKSDEWKKYWDNFNREFNKTHKDKKYWDKRQDNYQVWKEKCLSKMIIKDPKPHKFKDIFAEKWKVKKNEKKNKNI